MIKPFWLYSSGLLHQVEKQLEGIAAQESKPYLRSSKKSEREIGKNGRET